MELPQIFWLKRCAIMPATYKELLEAWLLTPPLVSVRMRLGPSPPRDMRGVTPGGLLALQALLQPMVAAGLDRIAVVDFRAAASTILATKQELVADWALAPAVRRAGGIGQGLAGVAAGAASR